MRHPHGTGTWSWLIAGWIMLLAACSDRTPHVPAAPAFRYTLEEVPSGFDPIRSSSIYASTVVLAVHDTLYRYRYLARPYELVPNLAAEMPEVSADGLTWTIRLRTDARFADDPAFPQGRGRAVVADDVVRSFQRHFAAASPSEGAWLWQEVLRGLPAWQANPEHTPFPVEAVDTHTVRFHLEQPLPGLAHTLVQGYSAITAHEAVERYGADLALRPVGSGPFVLRSFDGITARLERNPNYQRGVFDLQAEGFDPVRHAALGIADLAGKPLPLAGALELQFIADPQLRFQRLQRGETDVAAVAAQHVPQVLLSQQPLQLQPAFAACCHAVLQPLTEMIYLAFNFNDPELGRSEDPARAARNRSLRCAIAEAYDWQDRNQRFHQGAGRVYAGAVVPAAAEFNPDQHARTPDRARQHLHAAGLSPADVPLVRFASTGGSDMQGIYEHWRSQLMQHLDWPLERIQWDRFPTFGSYNDAINQGQLMVMDVGWRLDYPDALNTLQLFYGPYAPPQINAGAYRDAEYDAWFEAAQALPAGPQRQALVQQMNQRLWDECAFAGSFSRSALLVWRKQARVWPDREMLGGHFLTFAAVDP